MNYRRLGRSGLKISELSFGSWVTYGNQVDTRAARELMAAAFDAGVNFFDNAEIYAKGDSEVIMGKVLKELGWPRIRYVVSTKFYWGMRTGPNDNNTLNRKYLLDAIDGSLKRLQLDHVDLVYCHRADPANILLPVLRAEPQTKAVGERFAIGGKHGGRSVQAVAHIVAVQQNAVDAPLEEQMIDQIGDGALSASRQAREPDHAAAVTVELLTLFAGDGVPVPSLKVW